MYKRTYIFLLLFALVLSASLPAHAKGNVLAAYRIEVNSKAFEGLDFRINSTFCSKVKHYAKYEFVTRADCESLMNGETSSFYEAKNVSSARTVAKEYGINFMVYGKVYDSGDLIYLELILVDVESGQEVKKVKNEVDSSFSRLISVDMKKTLDELLS